MSSSERIPHEVKEAYLSSMGVELGTVFHALYVETVLVHSKWIQYKKLYGSGKEKIDLLNKHAGFLFKVFQDSLWADVLLHISRLTDPPKSAGKANLSITALPLLIIDPELKARISDLVARCVSLSEFAREHRNKRFAHKDLLHATSAQPLPLSGISRAHVEDMLSALRDAMNAIDVHYRDTTVMYDHFISNRDADSLLFRLERLDRYEASSGGGEFALRGPISDKT